MYHSRHHKPYNSHMDSVNCFNHRSPPTQQALRQRPSCTCPSRCTSIHWNQAVMRSPYFFTNAFLKAPQGWTVRMWSLAAASDVKV